MRKNRFSICLLGFLLACVGVAQTPGDMAGRWQGAIELPGSPLEVTVTFTATGAGLEGTIDIPAQGLQGIPLTGVSLSGSALTFAIQGPPGNPTFEGTLSGNDIVGTFSQSGATFPFTLSRADEAVTGGATTGGAETGGAVMGGAATGGAATGDAVTGGSGGVSAFTGGASGGVSGGAALSPKEALERFLTRRPIQADWFAESFLAQVPVSQLEPGLKSITDQLGTYESVEGDSSPFTVRFSQGTVTARISLDAQGRITTLTLTNLVSNVGSVDEAITKIAALPGQAGVLILKNGEEVATQNADTPLAVGSAFKLAVLAALQDQIEAGTHTWDEVVELKPEWKSLPSGILQDWPDNAPLTLQTLATLMISISDNTATDALINIVGRGAVEAKGERNRPFLTTQELFKLKNPQNSALLERYVAGDETARREVLSELPNRPYPGAEVFAGAPVALEAEWFFAPRELCALMAQVQALPLMSVSSGPIDTSDWARVAYKGGSEPGVLNLTAWLNGRDGANYCVTVTQNNSNAPVDEEGLVALYQGLLGALE